MIFWIGVAAASHVRLGVAGGFCMFAHGKHSAARRVSPGDWVTYYAPREEISAGAEVRAFTAIGQVQEGEMSERLMVPGVTGWSRPMHWRTDARPADIYPLLDRFSFVKDRAHWGMYFRKSLFAVERCDFALVADAMGIAFPEN